VTETALARRARHRRQKAARHGDLRMLFARRLRNEIDDGLTDEEFMEAVRHKLYRIHQYWPGPARGVKR
jgi:hypothetical protein